MEDGLDAGILSIGLADGDESAAAGISTNGTNPPPARNAQSEEEFQGVRKGYRVKVEDGEAWRNIKLPLKERITKPESQTVLHAVEELYFFKQYREGANFTLKVLESADLLDTDTKELLQHYLTRCRNKAGLDMSAAAI